MVTVATMGAPQLQRSLGALPGNAGSDPAISRGLDLEL